MVVLSEGLPAKVEAAIQIVQSLGGEYIAEIIKEEWTEIRFEVPVNNAFKVRLALIRAGYEFHRTPLLPLLGGH